ncbi:MAG: hypothetical protein GY721_03940 [Deltaproteobacteria bacterium]|nr:hypothetical protein [Deltaproteobacteria bacterium]
MRSVLTLLIFMALVISAYSADIPRELTEVLNLRQPAPNRYAAGQPEANAFAAFAEAGVEHVINLRPLTETPDFNEAAFVTQAGMAYYNIPIGGPSDLIRSNVLLIDRLLRQISDEKVLVHCASSNRVGALMALQAVWVEGASVEEALAIGKSWGLTRLQPLVERLLSQ